MTEVVMTAVFLFIILGATDTCAAKGFGPLAIGEATSTLPPSDG